ncbi:MAG: HAD-IA family hydrolase [Pseudomonadota bacterium]
MNLHSSASANPDRPDWKGIDTVLLDMDGTILDLNYDNYVWNTLVPYAFAEGANISIEDARDRMRSRMMEKRGSIDFYRFNHWSEFCNIDMIDLHEQATHLIQLRPGTDRFIHWLRQQNRQILIATNADRKSFDIKQTQIDLKGLADEVISSHDYNCPKESQTFWDTLHDRYAYDPARTLFIDDNEPVLEAAAKAGIGHLLCVNRPDSNQPKRENLRYPSFDHFEEIMPLESDR